jgi:hypothetical protein
MPPILLSSFVKWTLGAVGAAAFVHWVVREARRINAELDEARPAPVTEVIRREDLPTLRRDPRTGEYRP